jgi:D-glycero-D-manno-heptose 1,7-bisphosphate phosphatase
MHRAVFLDRDGVINQDPPHYAHRIDQLEIIPHVAEAIRLLNEADFKVIVVSNQSGIAKGYYQEEDAIRFNEAIRSRLHEEGALIDAFYFCPHHPEAENALYRVRCNCRKPSPGLLIQAAKDFDIDLTRSYMIGDKISDIKAGESAGCMSILVLTGHGKAEAGNLNLNAHDIIVPDLFEGVKKILSIEG